MKNVNKFLYTFFCFVFIFVNISCSMHLSANYWKGSEEESRYVEKKYKSRTSFHIEEASNLDSPLDPFLKNGKDKFKIGIIISGDYWEFFDNFKALIEGFSNIGWANRITLPSSFSHCDELLLWLNNKNYSDYIEFSPEYFIDLNWGDNLDELTEKYLEKKPNVDIIYAYGGKAAQSFYELESYPIPVITDAITDCVQAGVSVSLNDSGKEFLTNKIDPEIYRQQIRLFHDFVKFEKLGIIYEDTPDGYLYGAVNDVELIAKERGFEIVRNTNIKEYVDSDTEELYINALKDIVNKCDAVYISGTTAVTEFDSTPKIVEILNNAKKPSFSLEGTIRVKDGILFSLSSSGMTRSGIYQATKASHILSGISPRSLNQKFENTFSVAINLETAKNIGYNPSLDLLVNSDEFYIQDKDGEYKKYSDNLIHSNSKETLLPKKRNDNRKFKIAVIESGEYWEFTEHLKGIINGLITNRWIKSSIDVSSAKTISQIFDILSKNDYSDYIEFDPNYFINVEWGNRRSRTDIFFRNTKPDVDLIIGFGGVVGKLFSSQTTYPIPVLLEGITDPVGSGVVYSVSDSGKNFITCRVDQTQYQRQIEMFKKFTDFNKLGIVYGDDEYGRLYGAVDDVELMSLKLGFEIVKNTNVKETVSSNTVDLYLKALKDVCSKADAVYIGAGAAVTEYDIIPQIVKIIEDAKIPSFALEGDIRVKEGILLGVSSFESEKIGLYNAEKIASILYGQVPRLLDQDFKGSPSIALNYDMAKKIGLDLPLSELATIDQIYGEDF